MKPFSSGKVAVVGVLLLAAAVLWYWRSDKGAGIDQRLGHSEAARPVSESDRSEAPADDAVPQPDATRAHIPVGQDTDPEPVGDRGGPPRVLEPEDDAGMDEEETSEWIGGIDPHEVPPELLEFAEDLAGRMETALKSPQSARGVYGELERCVHERDLLAARAMCFINAGRLAELYPEMLGPEFERLAESVPEELKALSE